MISATIPLGIESPYQGFGVAMAAAQQLAMMTSQGISFIPHSMPGLYTSQSGAYSEWSKYCGLRRASLNNFIYVLYLGLMFTPPHAFPHPHPLISNGLLDSLPAHASSLISDSGNSDLTTKR